MKTPTKALGPVFAAAVCVGPLAAWAVPSHCSVSSAPGCIDTRDAAIGGASDASYTIEDASETAYYWAAAWNVKDGKRSQAVFTEAAEVKLAVEATPMPLPTEAPEPSPERSGLIGSDINFQLVMFSVIGLLALAALIGVVIFLRKDSKNKAE